MNKVVNISGQKFGMLMVVRDAGTRTKAGKAQFLCRCECGKEKVVTGGNLRSGSSKSCGCDKDKKTAARSLKHGLSSHPSFARYIDMMARCYTESHAEYKNYGGRGISVCDRWRDSVENFILDIGSPPTKLHSIDRRDNDGNYSPNNVRWASKKEQSINRRITKMYTNGGTTMCAADWGRKLGMTKKGVLDRIKDGWPIDLALTTPAIEKGKHKRGEKWQQSQGIKKKV